MLSSRADTSARRRLGVLAPLCLALLCLSLAGGRGAVLRGVEPAGERRPELPRADRLREGDVVFRRGRSVLSNVVLSADAAAGFSHVGLLRGNGRRFEVIHAIPGEGDGAPGGVVAEPLEEFLAPAVAAGFAVYRPRATGVGAVAARAAARLLHRPFDSRFDLATASHVYCTELVWLAYLRAGVDLADGQLDQLDLPLHRGPVLLLSRLRESRHLVRIAPEPIGDRHARFASPAP